MTLVSTDWLENNLSKVKVLDASWHMPSTKRDVCQQCECEHCTERPLNVSNDWAWQDSGIEAGF